MALSLTILNPILHVAFPEIKDTMRKFSTPKQKLKFQAFIAECGGFLNLNLMDDLKYKIDTEDDVLTKPTL